MATRNCFLYIVFTHSPTLIYVLPFDTRVAILTSVLSVIYCLDKWLWLQFERSHPVVY